MFTSREHEAALSAPAAATVPVKPGYGYWSFARLNAREGGEERREVEGAEVGEGTGADAEDQDQGARVVCEDFCCNRVLVLGLEVACGECPERE